MKPTIISNSWTGVIISLLVALVFGAWSLSLGQDMNWDMLNYHLYNPYAFLNDRIEFDLAPAGVQTYFSPILDIAYFSAISNFSPRMVGFLLGFLHGLNFLLIYKIADRILKDSNNGSIYALLLALMGVLTVGFLAEVGTTMHDTLVALFPLLSLWMILSSIDAIVAMNRRPYWAWIIGAGVIAGTGIGLKLVMGVYALPLCLAFVVLPVPFLQRFKIAFVFGLAVLGGLLLTGGYWLFETWRLFGNPLFPQFNNYFHGELAVPSETRDLRFLPKTLFDKIFYPILFTIDPQRAAELVYRQYSWLITYIVILGLFAYKGIGFIKKTIVQSPWTPEAVYLLAFFCFSYFLWLNIFGIYRYLVVIEVLIPLILFVIITYTIKSRFTIPAVLACLGLLTVINTQGVPNWGHADWADSVYRIEADEIELNPQPAAIYLSGQPLAWLVPALDIRVPFIQLAPNMGVSEAYWQRAKMLTTHRDGKRYIIYGPDDTYTQQRTSAGLEKLGLSVDDSRCGQMSAFLGKTKTEYRFCELNETEPN